MWPPDPILLCLLTFFLGVGLGHWLSLGRDKRKEFNDAARPIRKFLLEATEYPSPFHTAPSRSEVDAFSIKLSKSQRRRFIALYNQYFAAIRAGVRQDPQTGDVTLPDISPPREVAEEMLVFTAER